MPTPTALQSIPVHDGIEEWMAVALTGGLSAEERSLFEDHLAGCARCRELFAEENAMSQTIQNAFETVRPYPGFERRLTSAFRQRVGSGFGERLRVSVENVLRRPAWRVLGAAVLVVALIALGMGLTNGTGESGSSLGSNGLVFAQTAIPGLSRPVPAPTAADADAPVSASGGLAEKKAIAPHPFPFPLPLHEAAENRAIASQSSRQDAARAGSSFDAAGDLGSSKEAQASFGDLKISVPIAAPSLTLLDGARIASSAQNGQRRDLSAGYAVVHATSQQQAAATSSASTSPSGPVTVPAATSAPPPPPADPSAAPAPQTGQDTRKLIRNATVSLEVASFDPALDALGAAASQVGGGYVATVDSSRLANGKRRGTVVIKVLPDRLDAFLARLKELGDIKSQKVSTEDVTKDYFDTEARLRNARRMEDRLLKLLDEDKGKLNEILQVEKELGRVREDIEKMQGELQLYDSLVRYATVTIDLFEKDLKQPATFLLQQTAHLSLLAGDVEKTYTEARHVADDAHAQIENSDLVRADDGRVTANLRFLLAPDSSDTVIARIKALARVENFKVTGERTAQNGDSADTDPNAADAKVEHGPVTLNLSISHDEETHRRVTLNVTAADPAAAFDKSRDAGVAAGSDIVSADFTRTHGAHGNGVLVLRVPANRETGLLETVRSLGRTSDLTTQRDSNAAPDADSAPILLTLNFGDEPVRRRLSLTLIAPDLDAAFDKARTAALAGGAEVIDSSFNHSEGRDGTATLNLLIPGKSEAAILATVRGLGRSRDFNIQRDTSAAENEAGTGPVSLTINFAAEEPSVQQTTVGILCTQVDKRQAEVRKIAADSGAQVRSSVFEQGTEGNEDASLVFRLPLRAYPGFISRVEGLGEVKELNVHREDHPQASAVAGATANPANADGADESAPAEVSLHLYSQGHVVSDESGLFATFRRTLGEGVAALMWSLRMIGVAVGFLAPWVLAVVFVVWLRRLIGRRRAKTGDSSS
jgi:hypothetical protein